MTDGLSPIEDLLLQLIEIDSPTGEEGPLADWVEATLTGFGWRVRRHGLALVADRPEQPGPRVGLFGHLDVVTDRQMAPIAVDATTIYGPGTSDMKGGLAVMMELARTLPKEGLRAEPVLIFYDAEEGPIADNGLGPLWDATPDLDGLVLGICLEPTAGQLQLGCVGSLHVELTCRGQAGHAARPWEGENAITGASNLLARLHGLQPGRVTIDGLTFANTTTVTRCWGGKSRNSVPASFTMNVNLRFVPGRTAQEAFDDLEAWLDGEAELRWVDASNSAPVAPMTPLLSALVETGGLAREAKQAWTDVAQLADRGVPGVNYGPGDPAWAHQAGERIDRADLARCAEVLSRWLCAG